MLRSDDVPLPRLRKGHCPGAHDSGPLACWRVWGGLQCGLFGTEFCGRACGGFCLHAASLLPVWVSRRTWGAGSVYDDCPLLAGAAARRSVISPPLPAPGVVAEVTSAARTGRREHVAQRTISGEISAHTCACFPSQSWRVFGAPTQGRRRPPRGALPGALPGLQVRLPRASPATPGASRKSSLTAVFSFTDRASTVSSSPSPRASVFSYVFSTRLAVLHLSP